MAEEVRRRIDGEVDLRKELKSEEIDPREIVLLDVNAHFMPQETYARLVENVKRDGILTSVPLCDTIVVDGVKRRRVLSGNHRVQAAIDAGIEKVRVLYVDRELPKDQKLGIQLSHNSIVGEDDSQILRELFSEIDDMDLKIYTGIDDKALDTLEAPPALSLSTGALDFREVQILFLPDERDKLEDCLLQVKNTYKAKLDALACRQKVWDKWLENISKVHEITGIGNSATALMVVLELVNRHMDEIGDILDDMEANDRWYKPLDEDKVTNMARNGKV